MADIPEHIPDKEPKRLSEEVGTTQMEIDTKPKAPDKTVIVDWKTKHLIKDIINTPKETGSSDPLDNTTPSSGGSKVPPKEDQQAIISRLDGAGDGGSSKGPDSTPPTTEESKESANMIVDIFDAVFMLAINIISKDADDEDYKVDSEKKRQLKSHLSSLLQIAGKKIPVIWLFVGLAVLAYGPILLKALKHRKLVNEQKEKDKQSSSNSSATKTRKRRDKRASDNGSGDITYYEAVEVR